MSYAVLFTPKSMTVTKYEEVLKQLDKAGQGKPVGRLYHTSFGDHNQLRVFDVWDSMQSFERFGETLMPILKKNGVDPGQPDVREIHKVIKG